LPAEFAAAHDFWLLQTDDRRVVVVSHQRQAASGRIATSLFVPVLHRLGRRRLVLQLPDPLAERREAAIEMTSLIRASVG